jgi:hypothetical protein
VLLNVVLLVGLGGSTPSASRLVRSGTDETHRLPYGSISLRR